MKPAAIDIFSYIVEFSPSMVREFILKEGQNKDDVKENFNSEELIALNNLSIIMNEFQHEYKKNQNWHFTISEFFMIKHWVECWANASIVWFVWQELFCALQQLQFLLQVFFSTFTGWPVDQPGNRTDDKWHRSRYFIIAVALHILLI